MIIAIQVLPQMDSGHLGEAEVEVGRVLGVHLRHPSKSSIFPYIRMPHTNIQ